MELIPITALCITLSFLLTTCASQQISVQPSHDQALNLRVGFLIPPRKLRLVDEAATAKVEGGKELLSCRKVQEASAEKTSPSVIEPTVEPPEGFGTLLFKHSNYSFPTVELIRGFGKQQHKNAGPTHARQGTRQEWEEGGTNASQLFTMDYSHVRRRRPVNNKALPVSP